ncbi:MAG: 4-phosphoerythronate dehydrogenase [Paludibacteraceae bacterium]|nr:4-phosphoerythronate dehydrogenase [Paludibacteraceae bacterium]
MYKIVIDKYIPFLEGVFDGIGDVVRKSPEEFTPAAVRDADVLIVRTRTRCDASLLDGSSVKFIATATIGYDHIDTGYCKSHGISWASCPGCNAQAVCDYVEEVLHYCEQVMSKKFRSIGVVGAGNVGSLVVQMARNKGMRVVVCDPLRNDEGFVSSPMESIAECDVVSFHTPLTHDGESRYPTYRLCDEAFLSGCKRDALIINAARGGIVDEKALLESGRKCVIDCWECEPHINRELLLSSNTLLASYHIAGYSAQGKWNASQRCADAVYKWAGRSENPNLQPLGKAEGDNERGWLARVSEQLKVMPDAFEKLRKNYVLR